MTHARLILVPPGSPGTYHCVSRCVRRARLCGNDHHESGGSCEHRRQWVEDRIGELAEIFAVAVWGYAVMINHLHVVVQAIPQAASAWSKPGTVVENDRTVGETAWDVDFQDFLACGRLFYDFGGRVFRSGGLYMLLDGTLAAGQSEPRFKRKLALLSDIRGTLWAARSSHRRLSGELSSLENRNIS